MEMKQIITSMIKVLFSSEFRKLTFTNSPIFKIARFGVIGALFQIVPALTEPFKKKLGK